MTLFDELIINNDMVLGKGSYRTSLFDEYFIKVEVYEHEDSLILYDFMINSKPVEQFVFKKDNEMISGYSGNYYVISKNGTYCFELE